MSLNRARMESMLFHYETTYRTDYRGGEIKAYPKTVFQSKQTCMMRRPPPLKNLHTLSDWKGAVVPFHLVHKPKDIVRTNPNIIQETYTKPVDVDRERIQKMRPRLVMTPAVSMDDVDDETARNILVRDMYTSNMRRGYKEPVIGNKEQRKLPGRPAPANPIVLKKLQPPVVEAEWRMESISWDGRQLRAHCEPTKRFWLTREEPKCKMCEETAIVRAHRKA